MDLRPLRTDGARGPVSSTDSLYSRDRTTVLVQALLASSDVTQVLFNGHEIDGVRYYAGHHNHLHVQVRA